MAVSVQKGESHKFFNLSEETADHFVMFYSSEASQYV
jgi:hypothetical protein